MTAVLCTSQKRSSGNSTLLPERVSFLRVLRSKPATMTPAEFVHIIHVSNRVQLVSAADAIKRINFRVRQFAVSAEGDPIVSAQERNRSGIRARVAWWRRERIFISSEVDKERGISHVGRCLSAINSREISEDSDRFRVEAPYLNAPAMRRFNRDVSALDVFRRAQLTPIDQRLDRGHRDDADGQRDHPSLKSEPQNWFWRHRDALFYRTEVAVFAALILWLGKELTCRKDYQEAESASRRRNFTRSTPSWRSC